MADDVDPSLAKTDMTTRSQQWRAAVTAMVPLVLFALGYVPLPNVDTSGLEWRQSLFGLFDLPPHNVSIVALGLVPVLSGFTLVELVSLVVPRWRRLRISGPRGRLKLTRASYLVMVGLALFQSWGLARFMTSLGLVRHTSDESLVSLVLMLTMIGGTCLYVVGANVIDRWGLGNGFSVLFAFSLLGEIGYDWYAVHLSNGTTKPGAVGAQLVLAAVIAGLTYRMLRGAKAGEARHWLLLPACGVLPLSYALALPGYATVLGSLGMQTPEFVQRIAVYGTWESYVFHGVAVVGLGVLFAALFNRPKNVTTVAKQLGVPLEAFGTALLRGHRIGKPAVEDDEDGDVIDELADTEDGPVESDNPYAPPRVNSLLPAEQERFEIGMSRARTASVACVLVMAAIAGYGYYSFNVATDVVGIAVLVAVIMDLVAEWHMRSKHDIVAVWELHRVYAVPLVLRALHHRGIVAHARGLRHRTLLQFFGPWVPVHIFVPKSQAEKAHGFLNECLGLSTTNV